MRRDVSSRVLATLGMLAVGCAGSITGPAGGGDSSSAGHEPGGRAGAGDGTPQANAAPGAMAPPGAAPPSAAALPPNGVDPGRVALRRLNRVEYNNTVRDLLGTKLRPADAFAPDPSGFGFSNNGDVQTLSTLQLEQYQAAAEALVDDIMAVGPGKVAEVGRAPGCNPADGAPCLERLVAGFALRAWRRPATRDEVMRLMALANGARARGEEALEQLRVMLVAVLSSPHFLFRPEPDPDQVQAQAQPRLLGDYEVASRLSYFIYSSTPDDALFAAAEKGLLRTESEVRAQAARMLGDPKASALATTFATEWWDLRALDDHVVDAKLFGKAFDGALAQAMKEETARFFAEFLAADLPIADALTARFTFLNARLAQHYGLPRPAAATTSTAASAALVRAELAGSQRGGLLTHGSVLTTTSAPNSTNPVARGAWVLATIMCAPPPPPPADVPALPEAPAMKATTLRARFEAHRANPACAACHQIMDPIGFGLENYDAIGRWRSTDGEGGPPIDPTGTLPNGASFSGAAELAAQLRRDSRVPTCAASKLYTFALGRAPEGDAGTPDRPYLNRIVAQASGEAGLTVKKAILAIVASDAFRMRRGEPLTVQSGTQGGRP